MFSLFSVDGNHMENPPLPFSLQNASGGAGPGVALVPGAERRLAGPARADVTGRLQASLGQPCREAGHAAWRRIPTPRGSTDGSRPPASRARCRARLPQADLRGYL